MYDVFSIIAEERRKDLLHEAEKACLIAQVRSKQHSWQHKLLKSTVQLFTFLYKLS